MGDLLFLLGCVILGACFLLWYFKPTEEQKREAARVAEARRDFPYTFQRAKAGVDGGIMGLLEKLGTAWLSDIPEFMADYEKCRAVFRSVEEWGQQSVATRLYWAFHNKWHSRGYSQHDAFQKYLRALRVYHDEQRTLFYRDGRMSGARDRQLELYEAGFITVTRKPAATLTGSDYCQQADRDIRQWEKVNKQLDRFQYGPEFPNGVNGPRSVEGEISLQLEGEAQSFMNKL